MLLLVPQYQYAHCAVCNYVQEPSTAKLFVMPTHGSPNVLTETPMLHLVDPMQACMSIPKSIKVKWQMRNGINFWKKTKFEPGNTFCTVARALWLLHLPWLKLPQVPLGVPKLTNLIDEITWLGEGHSNNIVGPVFSLSSFFVVHISIGSGWDSETCEHKLPVCLVAKDNCVGFPPISSNNTRTFPLAFSHCRGTW